MRKINVVIKVSAPIVYWRLALAGAITGGKGIDGRTNTSKNALSSRIEPGPFPQPVFDCLRLLFTKKTQRVCGGAENINLDFLQRSVTSLKARKEDSIHTIADGFTIFISGKTSMYPCVPRISWWWICECSSVEGPFGDGPRRVADGFSACC